MKTFSIALSKANEKANDKNRNVYIIYNHVKCAYRISLMPKHSTNEELANYVNPLTA